MSECSSYSLCDHKSAVYDAHAGEEICTDCGLVILSGLSSHYTWDNKSSSCNFAENVLIRENIADVCSSLHLDGSCLVDNVLHILTEMIRKLKLSKFNIFSRKSRCVLAFAIKESLDRQGTPRSSADIANACDVSPNEILKMEKNGWSVGINSSYCAPSLHVDFACSQLSLPYKVNDKVKKVMQKVERQLYGHTPQTLVASATLFVLKNEDTDHELTKSKLSNYFSVSSRTIESVCKKIRNLMS